jgi:hypothetical protein
MLATLKKTWAVLPAPVRDRTYRVLKPTGLPYCLSYLAEDGEAHRGRNFAGQLCGLGEQYRKATKERKVEHTRQFLDIMNQLVLENGVRKTTYAERQTAILTAILDDHRFELPAHQVRVLDIPSSIGLTCLDAYALLEPRYQVTSYVMADLYLTVLYDEARGCIYDEQGNLLQVRSGDRFYSIYRPHSSGDVYRVTARLLFLPHDLISRRLKRRYGFPGHDKVTSLLLLHPEVEARLAEGVLKLAKFDVFTNVAGEYDLILSFNLLQKNYFSREQIDRGVHNLAGSLAEGGLLVLGNSESFSVSRKVGGQLELLHKSGDF